MPTSQPSSIPRVLELARAVNPDSVLDVGSGFGKYGFLLREYLECWQGRLCPREWKKHIDAVEIFGPYTRLPWYKDIYNVIFVADACSMLDKVAEYDLVLIADAIEHMTRDDGRRLLGAAKRYIVTTPAYPIGQGEAFGNKAETHVSLWEPSDFQKAQIIDGIVIGWKA